MAVPEPTETQWTYKQWCEIGHVDAPHFIGCQKCGLSFEAFRNGREPFGCNEVKERTEQVQERLKKELG